MSHSKGTLILTGANGGLGCGIVAHILAMQELAQYHSIYIVRDASQASALKSALTKAPTSHAYQIISLDLARLPDVREAAQAIRSQIAEGKIPPIRALILAAGYTDMGQQSETAEGFDTAFVANYLGHWLLTLMLLGNMDLERGRIVVVGSDSYDVTAPVHKLEGYYNEEKWKLFFREENIDSIAYGTWSSNENDIAPHAGVRRYGVAKMCLIMMIGELQRRLDTDPSLQNVSIAGVDPGVMGTGLLRRGNWITRVVLWPVVIPFLAPLMTRFQPNGPVRTVSKSAADVLNIALTPDPVGGQFFNDSEVQAVVPEAADAQKRLMVWRDSARYANLADGDTQLANWN